MNEIDGFKNLFKEIYNNDKGVVIYRFVTGHFFTLKYDPMKENAGKHDEAYALYKIPLKEVNRAINGKPIKEKYLTGWNWDLYFLRAYCAQLKDQYPLQEEENSKDEKTKEIENDDEEER